MPDADPMATLADAVDLHNEWPTEVTTARVVEAADALVRHQRDQAAMIEYYRTLRFQYADQDQLRRLMGLPVRPPVIEPLTEGMKGVVMVPAMDNAAWEAAGKAFDKALDEVFGGVCKTVDATPQHNAMCASRDNEPGPCDCQAPMDVFQQDAQRVRGCCASRLDAYHAADCQAPGVVREGEFDR